MLITGFSQDSRFRAHLVTAITFARETHLFSRIAGAALFSLSPGADDYRDISISMTIKPGAGFIAAS